MANKFEYIENVLSRAGIREVEGKTYPNTYQIEPGEASLATTDAGNRSNSVWKNAEYLILKNPFKDDNDRQKIIQQWEKLVSADGRRKKTQKLCVPKLSSGDEKLKEYEIYDAHCNMIYDGLIDNFIKKQNKINWKQIIYYGAPGTGKSYEVDCEINSEKLLRTDFINFSGYSATELDVFYSDYKDIDESAEESLFKYFNPLDVSCIKQKFKEAGNAKWLTILEKYIDFLNKRLYRTTFHPDYDYAQFVGAFKPSKGNPINYDFTPQVFSNAYVSAWKLFLKAQTERKEPVRVYLVVEEINRGNCAQIFGDLFQLLDRDENGFSRYSIDADSDMSTFIEKSLGKDYKDIVGQGKLRLPPNFNIYATMNTSDQSLFPMDSAFKRRFDWEYVPIEYNHDHAKFVIKIGEKSYKWLEILRAINKNILDTLHSCDKQMGEFFLKSKDGIIGFEEFRSKVLFYLWDSVYKDEIGNTDAQIFQFQSDGNDVNLTFQELFEDNDNDKQGYVKQILENLQKIHDDKFGKKK